MNLATILTDSAKRHPERTALKLDDVELTYGEVDDASARVAGLLRSKGMATGDRVGVMLPNVPYFAACYYGVLRAGGTVVPVNGLLKGREVNFYLEDPEAKLLLAWNGFAEHAEPGASEASAVPRGLQRLPARDRGGHLRAPGRTRGGGRRHPARRARRGGRRGGGAVGGRGGLGGRAAQLGQGAGRRLQPPVAATKE